MHMEGEGGGGGGRQDITHCNKVFFQVNLHLLSKSYTFASTDTCIL